MPKLAKGQQSLSTNSDGLDIQQKGASRFDVTTCTRLHEHHAQHTADR